MKQKNKMEDFFGILFGILGASLLGNLLPGKSTIKEDDGSIRAVESF